MSKNKNFEYLTALRAMAIVAVVMIHALANIVNQSQEVTWSWQVANFANLSLRWAVPIFIMISGALLLSKEAESGKVFVTKRLNKLLIPAVLWVGLYFLWFNRSGYVYMLSDYLEQVLVWGNPYYHLYFLYVIFGLYVFTPALRVWVKGVTSRVLGMTILTILLLSAYWSYSISLGRGVFPRETLTVVTHFLPYLGYYLAGYYLHKRYRVKKWSWLIWAAVVALWLSVILTTRWFSVSGYWAKSMMLEDYASINVVVLSVFVFVGIRWWYEKYNFSNWKWIESLAASALGIYLMHVIILEESAKRLSYAGVSDWGVVLGAFVISLSVSWLVTEVISRLPKIKKVVGR